MTATAPGPAPQHLGLTALLLAAGLAGGLAVSEGPRAVNEADAARGDIEHAGLSALMASSYGGIAQRSTERSFEESDPARLAALRALADKAQKEAAAATQDTDRRARAADAHMRQSRTHLREGRLATLAAASLLAGAAWVAAAGWRRTPAGVVTLTMAAAGVVWSLWPWLGG